MKSLPRGLIELPSAVSSAQGLYSRHVLVREERRLPDVQQGVPVTDGQQGDDWRTIARNTVPDDRDVLTARAAEPGRGRDAQRPTDIPLRGWRDIFWRVARSVSEDRVLATSGSVAFFALLAVFPATATIVSLYGLFADAHTIDKHLVLLSGLLPVSGIQLLGEQMNRIAGQSSEKLGLAFLMH
jgi:membrane protein